MLGVTRDVALLESCVFILYIFTIRQKEMRNKSIEQETMEIVCVQAGCVHEYLLSGCGFVWKGYVTQNLRQ